MKLTDERIHQIFYPLGTATENQKLIARSCARAIEAEVRAEAQEPRKVWSAETVALHFGSAPSLELIASVLNIAIADATRSAAPQPPAPCPKCDYKRAYAAGDLPFGMRYEQHLEEGMVAMRAERDALQAKVVDQELEIERINQTKNSLHMTIRERDAKVAELEKDVAKHLRTMRGAVVCCAHPSKRAAEEAYQCLDEALRANAIAKDAK